MKIVKISNNYVNIDLCLEAEDERDMKISKGVKALHKYK
jgi:hypothetical protein